MPGFTTRPEIRGTFGVVATTHWLASSVAMSVLERGGNAFDAAVAAGFTLQVVEPHLNGPLGEAPILVYSAANRRCDMICGQGVAQGATGLVGRVDDRGFRRVEFDLGGPIGKSAPFAARGHQQHQGNSRHCGSVPSAGHAPPRGGRRDDVVGLARYVRRRGHAPTPPSHFALFRLRKARVKGVWVSSPRAGGGHGGALRSMGRSAKVPTLWAHLPRRFR